jgi:hypothetical protein
MMVDKEQKNYVYIFIKNAATIKESLLRMLQLHMHTRHRHRPLEQQQQQPSLLVPSKLG